jgi:hypothetical protein
MLMSRMVFEQLFVALFYKYRGLTGPTFLKKALRGITSFEGRAEISLTSAMSMMAELRAILTNEIGSDPFKGKRVEAYTGQGLIEACIGSNNLGKLADFYWQVIAVELDL